MYKITIWWSFESKIFSYITITIPITFVPIIGDPVALCAAGMHIKIARCSFYSRCSLIIFSMDSRLWNQQNRGDPYNWPADWPTYRSLPCWFFNTLKHTFNTYSPLFFLHNRLVKSKQFTNKNHATLLHGQEAQISLPAMETGARTEVDLRCRGHFEVTFTFSRGSFGKEQRISLDGLCRNCSRCCCTYRSWPQSQWR